MDNYFWEVSAVVIILVFLVVIPLYKASNTRKRDQVLLTVAEKLNMEYVPFGLPELYADHTKAELFDEQSVEIRNIMIQAAEERNLKVMDVVVHEWIGSDRKEITQTVLLVDDSMLGLPPFFLEAKGPMDGIRTALRGGAIELEAHPNFHRLYTLASTEPEATFKLFNGELASFFEKQSDWTVQSHAQGLLVYNAGYLPSAERYEEFVVELLQVVSQLEQAANLPEAT